ncbi:MAG: hypothetical protein QXG00_00160 [Candidatus Woesearchaeota archaeon]
MELFQQLGEKAVSKYKLADHMLFITYPVVNDPKLLIVILDNLFQACELAMTGLLEQERMFKKIPPYPDNFEGKLHIFKQLMPKFGINEDNITFLRKMRDILIERKKSSLEFIKDNKFVMSDGDYNMRSLSVAQLKEYLATGKKFIQQILIITTKNAAILR